jgi:small subunit ribosomal protein S5
MLGVQDCLTKAFGSTNPKNLVKAVINGLEQLRSKELIASLRGVDLGSSMVEDAIERSKAFMTTGGSGEKAVAPVNTVGDKKARGGRGGRGGDSGRGGRGGSGGSGGARRRRTGEGEAPAEGSTEPAPQQ